MKSDQRLTAPRRFLGILIMVLVLAISTLPDGKAQVVSLQGITNTDAELTAWFYNTTSRKLNISTIIASSGFDASEIGNYYISGVNGVEGRDQVRQVSTAMRQHFVMTGKPYFGFFSFPSLPGFFDPADLAQQPSDYRSQSLDSLGRLWERAPDPRDPNTQGYRVGFTGSHLDITNRRAVEDLLANVSVVFDQAGGNESIGPLFGYFMFSEDGLSGGKPLTQMGVFDDAGNPSTNQKMRARGGTRHNILFTDDDPEYSFLAGVKRMVPLFSPSARDSFVAYAASRGFTGIQKLPADRDEFNHCGGGEYCVSLPNHVQFVPLSSTLSVSQQTQIYGAPVADYWRLWTEWCFKTWSEFVEEIARTITQAQAGNPDFKGVIYFQPPIKYALRGRYAQPVSYWYYNAAGQRVDVANLDMRTWQHYEIALENPSSGTDLAYLMKSPWFAGMVHETAGETLFPNTLWNNLSAPDAEDLALTSETYRLTHLAHGTAARKICEAEGKLFGAFFRTQYITDYTTFMTEADFARAFDYSIDPLQPALVFTISAKQLIPDQEGWPYNCQNDPECGRLNAKLLEKVNNYRSHAEFMLTELPWHRTVEEGEEARFSAAAAGGIGNHRYRWFGSTDGGATFAPLPVNSPYEGVKTAFLTVPAATAEQSGLYKCRVKDDGGAGKPLWTHPVQLNVVVAQDDFSPGVGPLDGRPTPVGGAAWKADTGSSINNGAMESSNAIGALPLDPLRLASGETLSLAARVRVQAGGAMWGSIGFTGKAKGVFWGTGVGVGAKIWMHLKDNGKVLVRQDGTTGAPLVSVQAPGWRPEGFNDLELQYRNVSGQHQARALVNGVEVMAWRAVTFGGEITFAGFQTFAGPTGGDPTRAARVDDFTVRGLGGGTAIQPLTASVTTTGAGPDNSSTLVVGEEEEDPEEEIGARIMPTGQSGQ